MHAKINLPDVEQWLQRHPEAGSSWPRDAQGTPPSSPCGRALAANQRGLNRPGEARENRRRTGLAVVQCPERFPQRSHLPRQNIHVTPTWPESPPT